MDPRLLEFFSAHPECATALKLHPELANSQYALERFVLEISKGKKVEAACQIALRNTFAGSASQEPNVVAQLKAQIARSPVSLAPGESAKVGGSNLVNFSSSAPLVYAEQELVGELKERKKLTIIAEEDALWQSQEADKNQVITMDPSSAEASEKLKELLSPGAEGQEPRQLLAWEALPSEHQMRLEALKFQLTKFFSAAAFVGYGMDVGIQLDEDTAALIVEQMVSHLEKLAASGRIVIPINPSSFWDFTPTASWERNELQLRTVLQASTGDNPLLSALLRQVENKRVGYWGLRGISSEQQSLNRLFVPQTAAKIFLKPLPEVEESVFYFPDILSPLTSLAIPDAMGSYRAVADSGSVAELFILKCLMQFLMADDESIMERLRGHGGEFTQRTASSRPLSYLLSKLTMGAAHHHDGNMDLKKLESITRIAATLAAYRSLTGGIAEPEDLGMIGALYFGPLSFAQIERVEVETRTPDQFLAFYRQGKMPKELKAAAEAYQEQGIEFSPTPPVDSYLGAHLGMAELLEEEMSE